MDRRDQGQYGQFRILGEAVLVGNCQKERGKPPQLVLKFHHGKEETQALGAKTITIRVQEIEADEVARRSSTTYRKRN